MKLVLIRLKFLCLVVHNSNDKQINIEITSASLQPFTEQQWRINQQHIINTVSTEYKKQLYSRLC